MWILDVLDDFFGVFGVSVEGIILYATSCASGEDIGFIFVICDRIIGWEV